MTREQYVTIRNKNVSELIYTVYTERHDPSKHGKLLDVHTMLGLLNIMTNVNELLTNLIDEYDKQFNITTVRDKEGKLIKVL